MAWFKVDDGLHSHPKAIKAGDALALWVVAGSWSADQLTDGFVPEYMANRLSINGLAHAARLVEVGLWTVASKDGEAGWCFHEWGERNPASTEVKANREASAERQRRWRENRRNGRRNGVTEPSTDAVTNAGSNGVSNAVSALSPPPPPTRPDPTAPSGQGRVGRGDDEAAGVEIDQEGLKQRLAERAYAGGQTDDTVKNEALAEMRSRLPRGTSLSRWPKNGEAQ